MDSTLLTVVGQPKRRPRRGTAASSAASRACPRGFQRRRLFAGDVCARAAVDDELNRRPTWQLLPSTQARRLHRAPSHSATARGIRRGYRCSRPSRASRSRRSARLRSARAGVAMISRSLNLPGPFVGVETRELGRPGLLLLRHERPLQTCRKPGAAAAAQPGSFTASMIASWPSCHQLGGLVPIAARLRRLQPRRLEAVEVGEDAVLVGERMSSASMAHRAIPSRAATRKSDHGERRSRRCTTILESMPVEELATARTISDACAMMIAPMIDLDERRAPGEQL